MQYRSLFPAILIDELELDVIGASKADDLYFYELDIIRILLNYGLYSVRTQNVEYNENGDEIITDVEVSVIELIVYELQKDEINFQNQIFSAVFADYVAGLEQGILYKTDHFIRNENREICDTVADIIASKHEVSANWQTQKVRIVSEVDKLDRAVMESIYSLKTAQVRKKIGEIQLKINQLNELGTSESIEEIMQLLNEHKKLDTVKLLLSDKLGRTII